MTDTTAPLSPRHERFVLEYLRDGNATQAYIRAGYSPRGAQPGASRLLRDVRIEAAVSAGRQRVAQALEATVERIAQEYAKIAFANVADFVSADANGRLRIDLDKASLAQQAGIIELRIRDNNKGEQTVILKLGKIQALAALTRHVGLLVEKPAPGLTAADRERYEDRCAGYRRVLDHREQEQERLRQELREARHALTEARVTIQEARVVMPEEETSADTFEDPLDEPPAPLERSRPPAVIAGPIRPAVEPGMPTEPPPDCTPGHLNGRIFWNTDRSPPPGPTWNEIIAKAGPHGFPGR